MAKDVKCAEDTQEPCCDNCGTCTKEEPCCDMCEGCDMCGSELEDDADVKVEVEVEVKENCAKPVKRSITLTQIIRTIAKNRIAIK